MKSARFKNAMTSTNAAALELRDTYQKVVEDLKAEIKNSLLAELKQEIQGGFNKLSPAVLSPVPRRFQFRERNTQRNTSDLVTKSFRKHRNRHHKSFAVLANQLAMYWVDQQRKPTITFGCI